MLDTPRLTAEAVAASGAAVVTLLAAPISTPDLAPWLWGGGFVSILLSVFAYGRLWGTVSAHQSTTDKRLKSIEEKLDRLSPQVAVALDRTEES